MTKREMYKAAELHCEDHTSQIREVFHVHFDADDNAGATCEENGEDMGSSAYRSDAYINHWYGSVGVLLSTGEYPEAEEFFVALGLKF